MGRQDFSLTLIIIRPAIIIIIIIIIIIMSFNGFAYSSSGSLGQGCISYDLNVVHVAVALSELTMKREKTAHAINIFYWY